MDAKTTGIVAYITWIGWLVAFLAGDKEGAKQHINQALIINIIAIIPLGITQVIATVFLIMGLIKAIQGDNSPLPVIGSWQLIK